MHLLVATSWRAAASVGARLGLLHATIASRPTVLGALALAAVAAAASPAAASTNGEDWAVDMIRRSASEERSAIESRHRLGEQAPADRPARQRRPGGPESGRGQASAREHGRRQRAETARAEEARPRQRHASLGHDPAPPAMHVPERRPEGGPEREAQGGEPGGQGAGRLGAVIASLGRDFMQWVPHPPPSLSGAPIRWVANADCLAARLRSLLVEVAASFGPVIVNSTCRSRKHNAQVGGVKRSFHLTGNAADFRLSGNPRPVLAFLRARGDVGGIKHYGGGVFHVDTGPRRTW